MASPPDAAGASPALEIRGLYKEYRRGVPVLIDVGRTLVDPLQKRRQWVRSLLRCADDPVRARIEAACDQWRMEVTRIAGAFSAARLARERDIAGPTSFDAGSQPGLFDRRAEHSRQARAAAIDESSQAAVERMRTIAAGATVASVPARLLLVLVP